jgi:hypothetical protein
MLHISHVYKIPACFEHLKYGFQFDDSDEEVEVIGTLEKITNLKYYYITPNK